jgi:hypothetical protein
MSALPTTLGRQEREGETDKQNALRLFSKTTTGQKSERESRREENANHTSMKKGRADHD